MDAAKTIVRYLVALVAALAPLLAGWPAVPAATASAEAGGAGRGGIGYESTGRGGGDPRDAGAAIFQGWAFDTCHTPSPGAMSAWRRSHYRAVGVYFAGRGRYCKHQPHLGRSWLRSVDRAGWSVLPIYVGSQAPCVRNKGKRSVTLGRHPWRQGVAEGRDAVRRARALGLRRHSAIYLDMEVYDHRDTRCARTTLAFVRAWNREVRARGYLPGFYSSAESGVRHMESARIRGVRDLPEAMWFARWRVRPTIYGEPVLARGAWRPHRRIHQFAGNVAERHGGVRMLVNRNRMDAPVALVG